MRLYLLVNISRRGILGGSGSGPFVDVLVLTLGWSLVEPLSDTDESSGVFDADCLKDVVINDVDDLDERCLIFTTNNTAMFAKTPNNNMNEMQRFLWGRSYFFFPDELSSG